MKKGISLIVLVITIIVIIILSGAVILSLSNNNPIVQATEASYKSNLNSYRSELALYIAKQYTEPTNIGNYDPKSIYATTWDGVSSTSGTIKEVITSISANDAKEYKIEQGRLIYVGTDTNKINYSSNMDIKDPFVKDGLNLWFDAAGIKNSPNPTTWIDRGSNNNFTFTNFSFNTSSGSDLNGSIQFDGVNDYLVGTRITSVPANNYTISAWINLNSHSTDTNIGQVLFHQYGAGGIIFSLNGPNSKLQIRNHNSTATSYNLQYNTPLDLNTWYYITATDDGTTVKLYLNGSLVASTANILSVLSPSTSPVIGGFNNSTNNAFKGKLESLQLYSRALTAAEVLKNYNAGM